MTDPLADLARAEGLPSAHAAALAAVDSVLRDRGLRQISPDQVAAAAWANAKAAVELDDLDEHQVAAVVRMLAEVPAVAEIVRSTPNQAVARLHAVWGRDLIAVDQLGVVRTATEVGARLRELTRLLTGRTEAPAVALAGIVHAELWTMRPFEAGSGAVALGMQQALLMATGVDPRGVIPVASGHRAVGGHGEALAHYGQGTPDGIRRWLLHHAAALTAAVELSPLA